VGDFAECTHHFTKDQVLAFAKTTGDSNPLHVDEKAAKVKMGVDFWSRKGFLPLPPLQAPCIATP
jgi:acyl dehydratase